MSYTSNSINGLKNLRSGEGWEEKRINMLSINLGDRDASDVLTEHRDWMLGGEHFEWRYHKDKITGDLILERR